MCNDFGNTIPYRAYVEAFAELKIPLVFPTPAAAPNLEPRDEVWPTDPATVIVPAESGVGLRALRWGFAPARRKAPVVINLRSEGRNFARGRCLVPASHYYEFTGRRTPKTRWRVTLADGEWFCFAGLLGRGADQNGDGEAFALLTVAPGPDIAALHDREPVILPREDWQRWLDAAQAAPALRPSPPGRLKIEEAPRQDPRRLPL